MVTARRLRKENIAEYLLYMWQVEDILRAFRLDAGRVEREYVARLGLGEEERKECAAWYAALCGAMRSEGVERSGHLRANRETAAELEALSQRLLDRSQPEPGFPGAARLRERYNEAYMRALPDIMELRRRGNGSSTGDTEVCLNALYGVMTLRLAGKPVSEDTGAAVAGISAAMALLAAAYRKNKETEGI